MATRWIAVKCKVRRFSDVQRNTGPGSALGNLHNFQFYTKTDPFLNI